MDVEEVTSGISLGALQEQREAAVVIEVAQAAGVHQVSAGRQVNKVQQRKNAEVKATAVVAVVYRWLKSAVNNQRAPSANSELNVSRHYPSHWQPVTRTLVVVWVNLVRRAWTT